MRGAARAGPAPTDTTAAALARHTLPSAGLALRLRAVRSLVLAADALLAEALFEDGAHEAAL